LSRAFKIVNGNQTEFVERARHLFQSAEDEAEARMPGASEILQQVAAKLSSMNLFEPQNCKARSYRISNLKN